MHLKVLLPHRIFADIQHVRRIVAETGDGSYGLLPQRLDCVAALVPGILTYETDVGEIHYLAVDEGVLVKAGLQVLVSIRNAIGGAGLSQLRELVEKEFAGQGESETDLRAFVSKLESRFISGIYKLRKE